MAGKGFVYKLTWLNGLQYSHGCTRFLLPNNKKALVVKNFGKFGKLQLFLQQILQSKVMRIYLLHDQKLTMRILLSCCQSATSCVSFIGIPLCEDTVLPLTALSSISDLNQQC